PSHRCADLFDGCGHLMAKDHRLAQAHSAEAAMVEIMEIGAADASEANPHPNLARANFRRGDLFDPKVLRGIGDDGAHGSDPSGSRPVKSAASLLACDRTAGERCRGRGPLDNSRGNSATGWPRKG